jgi:hypothetical protein
MACTKPQLKIYNQLFWCLESYKSALLHKIDFWCLESYKSALLHKIDGSYQN